ncbi:MAG: RNA-binding S4 domain-containing protein [Planctomycetota bacterium]|nr:RNA-binding S4 domain-containing protein [Planctomycetota bacterium]MCX8039143.1 RNA-binding S4 domain-containing protein [Planctomycetota bacterium]MDW8372565.1 RNA-binding S4 domain-containing protein [Planctomycetota bacterium]
MPGPEPPITLAQFLKLQRVADTGGQAKQLVRSGAVRVNGAVETRPGRQLRAGDRVTIDERSFLVER